MKMKMENLEIITLTNQESNVYVLDVSNLEIEKNNIQLTSLDLIKLSSTNVESKKKEILGIRYLRNKIIGLTDINYDSQIGYPFISNGPYISISHSNNLVALAINPKKIIGVDIEKISDRVFKLAHKFLSEKELSQLMELSALEITKYWSIKEVLYKIAHVKSMSFKNDLEVKNVCSTSAIGIIKKKNTIENIRIHQLNNMMICFNS